MRFGWHFVSEINFLIYNWCKPLDYYIILLSNLTNSSISSLSMKQPLPFITISFTSALPHNYDQSPITTSCHAVSPQPLLQQSTSSQYISSCFNLKYHFSTKFTKLLGTIDEKEWSELIPPLASCKYFWFEVVQLLKVYALLKSVALYITKLA